MNVYQEIDALRTRLYSEGDTSAKPRLETLVRILDRAAEMVVNREILVCVSGPFEAMLRADENGEILEDADNLYTNPDRWTAEDCAAWLDETGIEVDPTDYDGFEPDEYAEALRDLVRDNAEPAEVFEWWAVTSWFADWLRDNGHVVVDWFGVEVWGRETRGQAISMDAVISDFVEAKDLIANGWGDA